MACVWPVLESVYADKELKPTELVLWHSYRAEEKRALEEVIGNFNRSQKQIKVNLLAVPYDAYPDKINAAIPRGRGPDLFIFAHDRIGGWAQNALIEKITFWVDAELLGRFIPKTVQMLAYGDALYGLPLAFKSLALFYNKDMIATPPSNTEELLAAAKRLTDRTKNIFGLAYEVSDFYRHVVWFHGFGGQVFENDKLLIDSDASIQAMDFAVSLHRQHRILPDEPTSTLITYLFNTNKAAMVINGPWFRGEISPQVKYGVAPLPVVSSTKKHAAPFLTSEAVFISNYSKHKRLAFEVMKYVTSDQSAMIRMSVGKQTVANAAIYQTDLAKKDPIIQAFYKQMENSVATPSTPDMRMVWAPMLNALGKVFRGQATSKAALQEARDEILRYIKHSKKK
jgi:arabinogalactan oligomer/maltooligosaccharide transport system substrate-binding protein